MGNVVMAKIEGLLCPTCALIDECDKRKPNAECDEYEGKPFYSDGLAEYHFLPEHNEIDIRLWANQFYFSTTELLEILEKLTEKIQGIENTNA
jgi:hypothetical protein